MNGDVVGAVLAGGGSRRMGRDKALLAIGGVRLAARAMGELGAIFADTILVSGEGRDYSDLGYHQIKDRYPDSGPLAGLEAALGWAAPRPVFVLACDLPRVDRQIVGRLLEGWTSQSHSRAGRARIGRRDSRMQPLCALYSAACGEVARRLLESGKRSVFELVAAIESEPVDFDDIPSDPFLNVNTPADVARAADLVAVSS